MANWIPWNDRDDLEEYYFYLTRRWWEKWVISDDNREHSTEFANFQKDFFWAPMGKVPGDKIGEIIEEFLLGVNRKEWEIETFNARDLTEEHRKSIAREQEGTALYIAKEMVDYYRAQIQKDRNVIEQCERIRHGSTTEAAPVQDTDDDEIQRALKEVGDLSNVEGDKEHWMTVKDVSDTQDVGMDTLRVRRSEGVRIEIDGVGTFGIDSNDRRWFKTLSGKHYYFRAYAKARKLRK